MLKMPEMESNFRGVAAALNLEKNLLVSTVVRQEPYIHSRSRLTLCSKFNMGRVHIHVGSSQGW